MVALKKVPQSFSAAFFVGLLVIVSLLFEKSYAAEDSLLAVTYGSPSGNSVMSTGVALKSPVGIWNLKKTSAKTVDNQPVAVWFHGGMTSGNCAKGLVAGGDLAKMLPDFIVISASACRENHWVTPVAVGWVESALDSIARRRGKPVDQVYLVGISDGALGVLAYSVWGRRQAVSRLLMSSYGASFGNAAEIASLPRLREGRWRFIQGGSDRLYPADVTVPWITEFCNGVDGGANRRNGVPCELKFDPAGEHDWSYWKEHRKDWILDIFKEK